MENNKPKFLAALLEKPNDRELRMSLILELCQDAEWNEVKKHADFLIHADPTFADGHLSLTRATVESVGAEAATFFYFNARVCRDFTSTLEKYPELLSASTREKLSTLSQTPEAKKMVENPADKTHFSDIVGMEDLKKKIRLRVVDPYLRPELFEKFGKVAGGGILLYGPPGCGKTMLARAIASEVKAQFISVEVSQILGKYIGESEKNLAEVFRRARESRPCVIMFDELDALAFSRSKSTSEFSHQLVNEFLNQLDGIGKDNKEILFMAATNMPWDVDSAMKRPGRFNRLLFVPPPDESARAALFEAKLKPIPCDAIDFGKLAALTPKASGSDINGIIDSAKEILIEEIIESGKERNLTESDLLKACKSFSPSTTEWLRTAQNLVRFGNADKVYQDLEEYFTKEKI